MSYQFKYSDLEALADTIKANADCQLDALAKLKGQVDALVHTDDMTGEGAAAIKSYYSDLYGSIVPIMSLVITNHAKNCLLYIRAYANADMGGDTAISVEELNTVDRGIKKMKGKGDAIHSLDSVYRRTPDFVSAMDGSIPNSSGDYNKISTARMNIAKHIDKIIEDIDTIENYYKKSQGDYGKEFTAARVALANLGVLLNQRGPKSARILNYDCEKFWTSETGEKLKKAGIALWYEGDVKREAFKDAPVSDNEYDDWLCNFDKRENGDDLDYNKYFQPPFNTCIRNYHGGNCTWYAFGRWLEAQGYDGSDTAALAQAFSTVNAVNFWERAEEMGLERGQEPREGAIMVWGYDGSEHGQPGHVAFVESVDKNGNVKTTESGWSGGRFWHDGYSAENGYAKAYRNAQFRGFIYPKGNAPVKMNDADKAFLEDLKKSHPKSKLPVETMSEAKNKVPRSKLDLDVDGKLGPKSNKSTQAVLGVKEDKEWGPETVKAIQKKVGAKVDGEWGPETTRAMQKYLGVKEDGVVGPETSSAWQKFVNEELGQMK